MRVIGHHLDLQHLGADLTRDVRDDPRQALPTRPTSTFPRYFGQDTRWYFAENTVVLFDRQRTQRECRAHRTQRLPRLALRGRLDPRLRGRGLAAPI